MAKRKVSLDATVKKAVEEKVEEALEKSLDDQENDNAFLQSPSEEEIDTSKSLNRTMSAFPSAEGYYGKIHKIESDSGSWELKDYIIEENDKTSIIHIEIFRTPYSKIII